MYSTARRSTLKWAVRSVTTGVITGKNGAMTVSDVQKTKDGKYMHIGVVTEGELSVGRRGYGLLLMRLTVRLSAVHHTSTHLLQKALRAGAGRPR